MMIETRYTKESGIYFDKIEGYNVTSNKHVKFWQHIDNNDGLHSQVGPLYKTKLELLSDHENYLKRAGWIK